MSDSYGRGTHFTNSTECWQYIIDIQSFHLLLTLNKMSYWSWIMLDFTVLGKFRIICWKMELILINWPAWNTAFNPIEHMWNMLGTWLWDNQNLFNNLEDVRRLPIKIWDSFEAWTVDASMKSQVVEKRSDINLLKVALQLIEYDLEFHDFYVFNLLFVFKVILK